MGMLAGCAEIANLSQSSLVCVLLDNAAMPYVPTHIIAGALLQRICSTQEAIYWVLLTTTATILIHA